MISNRVRVLRRTPDPYFKQMDNFRRYGMRRAKSACWSAAIFSCLLAAPAWSASGSIAAGGGHSCRITAQSGVECWGENFAGQLGDGTGMPSPTPVPVVGLSTGVQAITAGTHHTCAVTTAGAAFCWGTNNQGQLGDGTNTLRTTPVPVTGLTSGVQAITAGRFKSLFPGDNSHTCALTVGGAVLCWGRNNTGQLGDGTTTPRLTPVPVTGLGSGVLEIAAGGLHTCARTSGGAVQCWGFNNSGQLGDSTNTQRLTPVPVTGLGSGVQSIATGVSHSCAVNGSGALLCWGINFLGHLGNGGTTESPTPVAVSGLNSGVAQVAAGYDHTCARTTAGAVQCWGFNGNGQLGDGTTVPRLLAAPVTGLGSGVQAISAGLDHNCALAGSGAMYCWGRNDTGQIGDGTTTRRLASVPVTGLGGNVQGIGSGNIHTCAVDASGAVKCWGRNSSGQLGDGTTDSRSTPVAVSGLSSGYTAAASGSRHSCALSASGAVSCWGANSSGQLGNGTTNPSLVPVPVTGLGSNVSAISAGDEHTCALTNGGAVVCWGLNDNGQLGDGTTTPASTPVPVTGLGSGIGRIAAGFSHTCALTTLGAAQCWGANFAGQLGDNSTSQRTTPVGVSGLSSGAQWIAGGGNHSCAVNASGAIQCWGLNSTGQLGDGTGTDSLTPVSIVGSPGTFQAVTAGGGHSCALDVAGAVLCWGLNDNGQVGDGSQSNRLAPVPAIGLASGVSAISAGFFHTCAIGSGGAVQCWGDGNAGQLGNVEVFATTPRPVLTATSGEPSPGISLRGPATADHDDFTGASVGIGEGDSSENIVVGAPGTDAGGAVYLYVRSFGSLTSAPASQKGFATESLGKSVAPALSLPPPPGGTVGDKWGTAVAVSPDGTSIAVGAPLRSGAGRVFVFRMPSGGWDAGELAEPFEVLPPSLTGGITTKEFGDKLSYGANGTLIVGAPGTDLGANTGAGAAFAFADNGKSLDPLISGTLTATIAQTNARFGAAVATDDGVVAVGAPNESEGAQTQQGAAYIFSATGGSVSNGTRIQPVGGQLGDKFGTGIAVEGGTVIVGAPGDDTQAGVNSGSARVFRPGLAGIYGQVSVLLPVNGDGQAAGTAVAARPGAILLGAPLAGTLDKPAAGRAYLYEDQDDLLASTENPDAILENATGDAGDFFGTAVAIGTRRLIIGVPGDTEPDSEGVLQEDTGRTDTFILDRILGSGFE